jgi:hypothetical protein
VDARLKISIGDNHLEIEGSETLVERTYSDFKQLLDKGPPARIKVKPAVQHLNEDDRPTDNIAARKKGGKGGTKPSTSLPRLDIDFRPADKPSLK